MNKNTPKTFLNIFNSGKSDIIIHGIVLRDDKIEVMVVDRSINRDIKDINLQQPNRIWIEVYTIKDNKIHHIKDISCTHIPVRIVPETIGIPTGIKFDLN